MAAAHAEPRLLYSIPNIRAFHIQDGQEQPLNPSGPQTMSLLMVPTSPPYTSLSSAEPQTAALEEDFYLHLHLPPELDIALPATQQIYPQRPNSYLIPRWDSDPDSGSFTRIVFPDIGTGPEHVRQEDVDTFETILAQCTSFLERATPPKGTTFHNEKDYNPQDYEYGQGYAQGSMSEADQKSARGHIVLVDEENGSVVGEMSEGFNVVEAADLVAGSKREWSNYFRGITSLTSPTDPVQIQLPQDPTSYNIAVSTAPPAYLKDAMHPAYANSIIVKQGAMASRLIVTASDHVSSIIQSTADNFTKKTNPTANPITFTPTTHERVRKLNNLTHGAVGLSAKTVGSVGKYAQNLGATLTRRGEAKSKGVDKHGQPITYKPGILNKSMMAFSTVADGVDQAGRNLLASGSTAATTVVQHRYGPDAGQMASSLAGGVRNVGLVYIDAMGVSRKAVIKNVAKGMVVGKVKGGGDLVVGGEIGGLIRPDSSAATKGVDEKKQAEMNGAVGVGTASPTSRDPALVGFGNEAAPPSYDSGAGESRQGQSVSGAYAPEKGPRPL